MKNMKSLLVMIMFFLAMVAVNSVMGQSQSFALLNEKHPKGVSGAMITKEGYFELLTRGTHSSPEGTWTMGDFARLETKKYIAFLKATEAQKPYVSGTVLGDQELKDYINSFGSVPTDKIEVWEAVVQRTGKTPVLQTETRGPYVHEEKFVSPGGNDVCSRVCVNLPHDPIKQKNCPVCPTTLPVQDFSAGREIVYDQPAPQPQPKVEEQPAPDFSTGREVKYDPPAEPVKEKRKLKGLIVAGAVVGVATVGFVAWKLLRNPKPHVADPPDDGGPGSGDDNTGGPGSGRLGGLFQKILEKLPISGN